VKRFSRFVRSSFLRGPNPVVVKELRQAVRSRFIAGMLLLFLLFQLGGMGIILLTTSASSFDNLDAILSAGRNMFCFLYVILSIACIVLVPAYAGIRLGVERGDNNLDLLYITTLRSGAIIRGKLFASSMVAILLFSAAMPLMSFTYLLRGVDLLSVFMALLFCFFCAVGAIQTAIFLACIRLSRVFKVVLAFGALFMALWAVVMTSGAGIAMIYSGAGSRFKSGDFWMTAFVVVWLTSMFIAFLQTLSIALISPPSSNRALRVRLSFTVLWLIGWGGTLAAALVNSEEEIMLVWLVTSLLLLGLAVLVALSENHALSSRVRRAIPQNRFVRGLAFLFYNGPAGGTQWTVIMAACTVLLAYGGAFLVAGSSMSSSVLTMCMTFSAVFLYILAYALTAALVWRVFFSRRTKPIMTGVIALLMIAAGGLLPVVVGFATSDFSWDNPVAWHIGNVFSVGKEEYISKHMTFSAVWVLLAYALNFRWMWAQRRAFRPIQDT